MDKQMGIDFLFVISKEVRQFYETPVVFLTKKDFSDGVFNAWCTLRTALLESGSKSEILDTIVDLHLQWMYAVKDVENYNKRLNNVGIPREEVFQAVSYTIDAINSRLKYFQRYMEKYRPTLSNKEQANMNVDLEIIEEMHIDVTHALLQKLTCFRSFASDSEFYLHVANAAEELMKWFDKINDNLTTQLSNYLNVPHLSTDLTKTLQQIINDTHASDTPSVQKMFDDLKRRGSDIGSMIRCTTSHSLEISKIENKIAVIDDRIKTLGGNLSSAPVMYLVNQKEYLEQTLLSLENLKTTLKNLHLKSDVPLEVLEKTSEENICICKDFFSLRIFNHSLPLKQRERLVTELCYLWNSAVLGRERSRKSIISILSAAEIKEEFTDELGTFYIDEHSRKIYKLPSDDTLYQPNESNELVPLSDDAEHIYFYDGCGRYFIDTKSRQRVYKSHATASEYMMDTSGVLLKTKEERDGMVFYYDSYGRYYLNGEGKKIYRDPDSVSEYENDGLGNLVRIRSHMDLFELCPDDVNVTEDFKYLKQSVGPALRFCIAQCILHQPADPIKYLSASLIKFRENIEIRDERARENEALFLEREVIAAKERAAAEAAARELALLTQGGSECSYDSNLLKYTAENPVDVSESSK